MPFAGLPGPTARGPAGIAEAGVTCRPDIAGLVRSGGCDFGNEGLRRRMREGNGLGHGGDA